MKGFSGILLAISSASALALDFTPQYSESVQDGFPVRRLFFSDKEQRVYLTVPKDWKVSGNGQRGTFTPASLEQASVAVENSPLSPQVQFDEKGLETYRKAAAEVVPQGATNVQVDFEKTNEFTLNGWTSFEMQFSYQLFGQSFSRSVLFVNMDKDAQLRMRVEARKENFDKVYPAARGILASWFSPPPELEAILQKLTAKH